MLAARDRSICGPSLASGSVFVKTHLPIRLQPSLGDNFGAALAVADPHREAKRLAGEPVYRSALELSRQLAPRIRSTPAGVFDVLCHMPDAMLTLLATPQGWALLADYVARDLGAASLTFRPTVH
jgi:hypothetical protein